MLNFRSIQLAVTALTALTPLPIAAQTPVYKVDVDMVVLSFSVKSAGGGYVGSLRPEDVRVLEDGIPQQVRSFSRMGVPEPGKEPIRAGSVFVLYDTSDSMYADFARSNDAVANFVRGLPPGTAVAVYTFGRNVCRAAPLTQDRDLALRSVRSVVAGSETAIYDALLMTLRDAEKVPGHKRIVVFSNGPDNQSILSPDDVRRVAEEQGVPIYVLSTNERDPLSAAAFGRLAFGTGGTYYAAARWKQQVEAFGKIQDELQNSYVVSYYPHENAKPGFRRIQIEILNDPGKRLRIRARPGYRPQRAHASADKTRPGLGGM